MLPATLSKLPQNILLGSIAMGSYVNEIKVPGLDIEMDRPQRSFAWKHSLTNYFVEEAFVRNPRKAESPNLTGAPILEEVGKYMQQWRLRGRDKSNDSNKNLMSSDTSIVGRDNARFYTGALEIRIQKTYNRSNIPQKKPHDLEGRLRWMQAARRSHLFKDRMQK
jgi:hypothetical protein